MSNSSPRDTAMACAAKASLLSMMSIWCSVRPAFFSASFVAGMGPSPMMSFGTPATAYETRRAKGTCPAFTAFAASASTKKAAPSFRPDELPAVTDPPLLNAGFSLPRDSIVVSGFTCSSVSKTISPLRVFRTMSTIWDLKRPSAIAAAARRCDSTASASCSSRVMPHFVTRFSAVMPMCPTPKGSVSVAVIMSTSFVSPIRAPLRIAEDR